MEQQNKERPDSINVEDLLRLKRAERPEEAYWERFDAELHQRMLQTLVKKEAWHLQILRFFRLRFVQGAALACSGVLALLVLDRTWQNAGPSSEGTLAFAGDSTLSDGPTSGFTTDSRPTVETSYMTSASAAIEFVGGDSRDFRTDRVNATVTPEQETFSRDFSSGSFRVASVSRDNLNTDYGTSTVGSASARSIRLGY